MSKMVKGILAAGLFWGVAFAQQNPSQHDARPNSPQTPAGNQTATAQANTNPRFAPGTVIPVELTKSIDAKKAKTGDAVEAKVTQDLKAGNGHVIVPKDTKVVGHVTDVLPRNKDQKESQLGIAFDRAVIKGGNDVSMPMSIQAIISPNALGGGTSSDNNGTTAPTQPSQTSSGSSMPSSPSGRSPGMSTGSPSTTSPSTTGGEAPATTQASQGPHEQITANTQGVVGLANLKLSSPANSRDGSVVTSDKNNVKLESGTFMLLRVNQ